MKLGIACACWLLGLSAGRAQWSALGTGLDDEVRALLYDSGNERLYAFGSFEYAGDSLVNETAWWDGVHWHPLDSGVEMNAPVLCANWFDERLIIGGFFDFATGAPNTAQVAAWNNSNWEEVTSEGCPDGNVWNVVPMGERLYVCGIMENLGGLSAQGVGYLENGGWHALLQDGLLTSGDGCASIIDYAGDTIIAGNFTSTTGVKEIGRVIGDSLVQMGVGIPGDSWVNALAAYNGDLYVGGYFFQDDGNAASMLMKWDGAQWSDPFPNAEFVAQVYQLHVYDDKLYIAGPGRPNGALGYHGMAVFDGSQLCFLGGVGTLVHAIAPTNDHLYAAVGVDPFGPDSLDLNWIARFDLSYPADTCLAITSVVNDLQFQGNWSVHPNPGTGHIRLVGNGLPPDLKLKVFDPAGHLCMTATSNSHHTANGVAFDLINLAQGPYILRFTSNQLRHTYTQLYIVQ
jgi:hypothetical protein